MTNTLESHASEESDTARSTLGLTQADIAQLKEHGIKEHTAKQQLARLRRGSRFLDLHRPAVLGDGIEVLTAESAGARKAAFQRALPRTTSFVPASGAASRMFQELLGQVAGKESPSGTRLDSFFDQPWPFQTALRRVQQRADDPTEQLRDLLEGPEGLARLPKALVPFHRTRSEERTALEEHIREALELAKLGGQTHARVHFTLSPQHRPAIKHLQLAIVRRIGTAGTLTITDSSQHAATDTLALTADGQPLRSAKTSGEHCSGKQTLVLRPGGHGSLLRNLEETHAEIVLIKNIDNVQPSCQRSTTLHWKAALLGELALAQDEVFGLTEALESPTRPSDATTKKALELLARFGRLPTSHRQRDLLEQLQRPIRLCGVVANSGEPGGGPFWVRDPKGALSLQIAEGAQINSDSREQREILQASTHFNPVDLACSLRDRHGKPFDLDQFRDDDTYFVATKSYHGQTIRALEHPGLWNGAMAHWLTLFVEAPLETFTPVKTVWDLLRGEHQPS